MICADKPPEVIGPDSIDLAVTELKNQTLDCFVSGSDVDYEWRQQGDPTTVLATGIFECVPFDLYQCFCLVQSQGSITWFRT